MRVGQAAAAVEAGAGVLGELETAIDEARAFLAAYLSRI
jgi:hypothetical protein